MENKVKPITPEEVIELKKNLLPDNVIKTWNELIAKNIVNGTCVILQSDAEKALESLISSEDPNNIFVRGWLDIEDIYRKAGWTVTYDKPGYNESYPATFTFRKRPKAFPK